jgi:hypothetical protein
VGYLVSTCSDSGPRGAARAEIVRGRAILAVVTIAATLVFCGAGIIDAAGGDGTVPRALNLVLVLPPIVASWFAWHLRQGLRADQLIRGQFVSVATIFGGVSLIGLLGSLDSRALPVWILGAAGGGATVGLLWKPRRR